MRTPQQALRNKPIKTEGKFSPSWCPLIAALQCPAHLSENASVKRTPLTTFAASPHLSGRMTTTQHPSMTPRKPAMRCRQKRAQPAGVSLTSNVRGLLFSEMKTRPSARSSMPAQPIGAVPFISSNSVRGALGWFSFSASMPSAGPTETELPFQAPSLPARGAVDSNAPVSVAAHQNASRTTKVCGSRWPASSNLSVKRTCLRPAAYLQR